MVKSKMDAHAQRYATVSVIIELGCVQVVVVFLDSSVIPQVSEYHLVVIRENECAPVF